MNVKCLKPSMALAIGLVALFAIPSDAFARKWFWRREARNERRAAAENYARAASPTLATQSQVNTAQASNGADNATFVSYNVPYAPNEPIPDAIEMTFFKCEGENGNCGIIARGTVEALPGPPPVPVSAVYMLVNQACPGGCGSGSFSCSTPSDFQIRATIIWNSVTNKYDVTFGDINSANDRRIVKCNHTHTICIVVCYENGTCASREFSVNPSTASGTGFGGLTLECVYCSGTGGGGAGGGVP